MKTKALLFTLFAVTLFAVGTLVTVFFNTAPTTRDVIWLFYATFLISTFGLMFFGFFIAAYIKNRAIPAWQTTASCFRYAAILAVLFTVLITLNSHQVLNFASALVIIIALGLAELIWRRKGAIR